MVNFYSVEDIMLAKNLLFEDMDLLEFEKSSRRDNVKTRTI